jgi:hypothetical protein
MPYALIDVDDQGKTFLVRYADFVSWILGDLKNGARLRLAVLATAGADIQSGGPIPPPPEEVLYPDEALWFAECRLDMTGANAAALLATGFPWTEKAARAATEYPIAPGAVAWIRELVKLLHEEQVHWLQLLRDPAKRSKLGRTWEEMKQEQEQRLRTTLDLWGGRGEVAGQPFLAAELQGNMARRLSARRARTEVKEIALIVTLRRAGALNGGSERSAEGVN